MMASPKLRVCLLDTQDSAFVQLFCRLDDAHRAMRGYDELLATFLSHRLPDGRCQLFVKRGWIVKSTLQAHGYYYDRRRKYWIRQFNCRDLHGEVLLLHRAIAQVAK